MLPTREEKQRRIMASPPLTGGSWQAGQTEPHLRASKQTEEGRGSGPRPQEGVDLEGHHRPGVQPQGPGVLREVGQHVLGVEEAHHGHSGRYVH